MMNLEKVLNFGRRIIPKKIFRASQPFYHYFLALAGAIAYQFPSRKLNVVAVTGTKGKSTTVELINAILEEAGYKTAMLGTIRFKMAGEERRNLFKMTIRGRFFIQKFLREAVSKNCDYVVIEMTSEGAKQSRHRFIDWDAFVFTNISPEHIESHGSFEKYLEAKLSIAQAIAVSPKHPRVLVVNGDDKEAEKFLTPDADIKVSYSLNETRDRILENRKVSFHYKGFAFVVGLPGIFNIYNALAAIKYAETQNVSLETVKRALHKVDVIRGRVEFIECGQNFDVVVDYAHTIDSLEKFYEVFEGKRNICVLGNTGGGRDTWKRPGMAKVAEQNCEHIILTNEDPYDEDPEKIVREMEAGVEDKSKVEIVMDRRDAITAAVKKAREISASANNQNVAVLITGKGTDPYIMMANDKKVPWDDATVCREELEKLGYAKNA
jgi:UDP-N-acetylmuramoyl-L-alanyl-D-glutamate--2,6-diaminopimelate ligase